MNEISLKELSEKFEKFMQQANFEEKVAVYLLRTRATPTQVIKLEADNSVKNQLFHLICAQYHRPNFQEKSIVPYDPVVEKNETHKLIYADSYEVVQQTVAEILDENHILHSTNGWDESQFSDYMIQFVIDGIKYSAIGGFSTVKKIKKLGVFGNLTDNRLKNVSKEGIVGLNGEIHSVIIDSSEILVHGVQGFERVFELKKVFSSEAKRTLDEPYFKKYVSGDVIDQLIQHVGTGGRMARRLTKLRNDPSRNTDFFRHMSTVKKILANPNHPNKGKFPDVIIDVKTGMLYVPRGKEEQLINLISDGSYIAEVSEHAGYDEAR